MLVGKLIKFCAVNILSAGSLTFLVSDSTFMSLCMKLWHFFFFYCIVSRFCFSSRELTKLSQRDELLLIYVSSRFGCCWGTGAWLSLRKIFLICFTQMSEATSVSLESCARLRKPCGRSSTTVRLTCWPISRSFLANITESSSRASSAEAWIMNQKR